MFLIYLGLLSVFDKIDKLGLLFLFSTKLQYLTIEGTMFAI